MEAGNDAAIRLPEKERKQVERFVQELSRVAGANLVSVVLYGSAATPEFEAGRSDVNLLCVFERLSSPELTAIEPALDTWRNARQRPPMLLTLHELRRAADVFAIELLDIQRAHVVLHGRDVPAEIRVPMHLHRAQVERELRTRTVQLRHAYMAAHPDVVAVLALMEQSISSFATLLRHALIALGEQPPASRRELPAAAERVFGIEMRPLLQVLEWRASPKQPPLEEVESAFARYLATIERVTDAVDERFAAAAGEQV